MKKIKLLLYMLILTCTIILVVCNSFNSTLSSLEPSDPITVTLWHYHSGQIKDKFDSLVENFNETIGVDEGIVVDAKSLGDINQHADAVFNAASGAIGSQPMPHIFMSYPSDAYRVDKLTELVDLETLFSQEELGRYKDDFLLEGRFGKDDKLKIIPISKSTENLFLNKTLWDEFSNETGANIENLNTWEGIVEVAKLYKEHTGKAFIGIDSNANYMLISSMQLGTELYDYSGDNVDFNLTEDIAKTIWENYYIPHINGFFSRVGRYSSDDAKTGDVIAYASTTAGSAYFPKEVTLNQSEVIEVEPMTLPYPVFENGKPYAIQQGAGICVTKSDDAHEYASALFLKWFANPKQNVEFAVSTGYFPVLNESLKKEVLINQIEKSAIIGEAIPKMIESTDYMFENYTLYINKPFEGSYELRNLLESHLFDKVTMDLESLNTRIENGESRELIIESLTSKSQFEKWYSDIVKEALSILKK